MTHLVGSINSEIIGGLYICEKMSTFAYQIRKVMKLSEKDKKQLLDWGYNPEDMSVIENAINNGMEFITLFPNGENRNNITAEGAKRLLGTKEFLSGASRSTFHSTAIRENNKRQVYFHYKWW